MIGIVLVHHLVHHIMPFRVYYTLEHCLAIVKRLLERKSDLQIFSKVKCKQITRF